MRRGRSSSWENLFGRLVDGAFIRNGQDLGTDRPNSPALSRMSELEIQNPLTTHGWTQCAAVRTCFSVMRAAPQNCPEPLEAGRTIAANHGYSDGSAGRPPTIRVWNFFAFTPQAESSEGGNFQIFIHLKLSCINQPNQSTTVDPDLGCSVILPGQ